MEKHHLANPIENIKTQYFMLSKTQKKIADFILSREDIGSFLSLNELSEQADVTAVTVVRFCKKIGYNTFSDFKKDCQNYLQSMILPKNVVKLDYEDISNSIDNMLQKVIENEITLVNETLKHINYDSIKQTIEIILTSKKIHLAARGITIPVAKILKTRLDFLCIESELIKMENINLLPRKLLNCNEDDVFIIFSFPNYSQSLGDLAKCVKSLGSKIICITDKAISPPALFSDILLICQTSSTIFYNSMTAPSSLVNVIATLLAIELNNKLKQNKLKIKRLAEYFNNRNY
jgi:DNA-binding MurR/RpiR family transcriptional regulator